MKRLVIIFLFSSVCLGCTHGSVSKVPVVVPGEGEVYRYEGRANFSHQFAAADTMMVEHCQKVNGGRPVVVSMQKRDLGLMAFGSGTSNTNVNATATTSGNTTNAHGTANTVSSGRATALRNQNQELLFKCVAE